MSFRGLLKPPNSLRDKIEGVYDPNLVFSRQFMLSQSFFLLLHFLTWDPKRIRPEEEINIPQVVNTLTDPEQVSRNIVANLVMTAGTVSEHSIQGVPDTANRC